MGGGGGVDNATGAGRAGRLPAVWRSDDDGANCAALGARKDLGAADDAGEVSASATAGSAGHLPDLRVAFRRYALFPAPGF